MTKLALSRTALSMVTLLALALVVFGLVRITGDPVNLLIPDTATPEQEEAVRQRLALDQPLVLQFTRFVGQIVTGDLGYGYRLNAPVIELVQTRIPYTLQLAGTALLISVSVGIPLGVYSAYRRGTWLDRGIRGFAALGQAAPAFWVGLLLILFFALYLGWLPPGGTGDLRNLVLPAACVALAPSAGLTRLVRSSMIEVLDTDYIKFARIKGLPERTVLWKHALRNAGLSALTFVGVLTANLVTGSIVVERVFVWPGLGSLLADSISARDFPVVQAVVLFFAFIYVVVNLFVDLLYAVLNPRLRTAR